MSDDAERTAEAMVALLLRSTRRRLHEEITRDVHPAVDAVSYPILSGIDRGGPINSARLGYVVGLDRSFVSRLADRLIAAGLLRRDTDPTDRRSTLISFTDEGERVAAVLRGRLAAAIGRVLEDWSPAERHSFAQMLERFVGELASGGSWPDRDAVTPARR